MDLHPLFINRDVSGSRLGPAAGVEVLDAIPLQLSSLMGVAAENSVCTSRVSVS